MSPRETVVVREGAVVTITTAGTQGPPGPPGIPGSGGDVNYIHDQAVPSTVWTVTHSLNKYPSVTVIDTSSTEVDGTVEYIDLNSLSITFNASFAGKAILN